MEQYISKDAILAEIERLKSTYSDDENIHHVAKYNLLIDILSFLDTLGVKEINEELQGLQGLEKEVAEGTIDRINKKRIPIELKGEVKAKFKNEFHTMWQTIHGISFANVAKPILERLCLHFAAWGVYNLKECIKMKPEEEARLDAIKVKEVDLEKEIQQHIDECLDIKFPTTDIKLIAKDVEYTARKFFELGLKAKGLALEAPKGMYGKEGQQ